MFELVIVLFPIFFSSKKARNDTLTFESVRSTVQVDQGTWFYEVTILTNGIMQIGFATKSASFMNDVSINFYNNF